MLKYFKDRPVRLSRDEAKTVVQSLRATAVTAPKMRDKHRVARLANAIERRSMEDL